ncbi:cobalamin-binding protein [Halalkalibacterium ligniniphilum]|uniref:cobalamin-binding protein n=1 Tax=Halalkalibacterium ligniniphilum TaxID=1134413 RepID=UPI0003477D76|nr:cobalamin-binding protein [Halalkalibacterium ligniniphilum]
MRLISLCPSNTEKLAYLGLTDSLVAVDDYSDWPDSIGNLPRLGPDLNIDMDRVEALKPDLVVASLSVPGMERNVAALVERNIPHVVYNPHSLEEIGQCLHDLAKRTGTSTEAMKVVDTYYALLNDYKERAQGLTRKRLYWEWWPKPVFTPGGTNWLTEISALAGGENVYADEMIPSVKTDWDEVLTRDPDHICLAWVGIASDKVKPELLLKRPNWSELRAMKEGNLHILEEPLYCRPSPRLLLGLKKLAALLHPTVFPADDGLDPLFDHQ